MRQGGGGVDRVRIFCRPGGDCFRDGCCGCAHIRDPCTEEENSRGSGNRVSDAYRLEDMYLAAYRPAELPGAQLQGGEMTGGYFAQENLKKTSWKATSCQSLNWQAANWQAANFQKSWAMRGRSNAPMFRGRLRYAPV